MRVFIFSEFRLALGGLQRTAAVGTDSIREHQEAATLAATWALSAMFAGGRHIQILSESPTIQPGGGLGGGFVEVSARYPQ